MKRLCKHCGLELRDDILATMEMNRQGYFYVCQYAEYHEPMDNLDYIEYVAKQRKLV